VQGQSVGLLGQVADVVREQAVTADSLLERFVRTAFRRGPRESLPAPSAAVQARAIPGKLPTTASAASLQGQFAGYASRLAAFLVDSVVIGATTLLATWAAVSLLGEIGIEIRDCGAVDTRYVVRAWLCRILFLAAPLAGTAFIVAYNLIFWATTGQTPGKAVMGVRIVRLNGCPMNLLTAVRRQVGYLLSLASGGLGYLVILADDRRQGWHDKLAGTCVIYAWEARQNERLLERLRRGPRRQPNRHSS
jgi:uncharacterized RDD family membrane protein YckC